MWGPEAAHYLLTYVQTRKVANAPRHTKYLLATVLRYSSPSLDLEEATRLITTHGGS